MIKKLVDARCDFRLQGIDHLVHHADRQACSDRLALELGGQIERHGIPRLIALLICIDRDFQLRLGDLDTCVLEAVITALGVKHGKRQVGRKVIVDRYAHAVLGVVELLQLEPIATRRQQCGGFHLVAFQCQQRITHRLGEGDQCHRFGAGLILVLVKQDFYGARYRLNAITTDRVAGGPKDQAMLVLKRDAVSTGAFEIEAETCCVVVQAGALLALVFQTHPLIAGRFEFSRLLAAVGERHRIARRAEARWRLQTITCSAALNKDFLADLDPISSTVAGKYRKQVTAWLVRRRQVEFGTPLAIGGQLGTAEFYGELTEILQLVVDHRQLLGT